MTFGLADRGTVTDQSADGLTGYGTGQETCESFEGPFFSFVNVGAGDISISSG